MRDVFLGLADKLLLDAHIMYTGRDEEQHKSGAVSARASFALFRLRRPVAEEGLAS